MDTIITAQDVIAILPEIVVASAACVLLLVDLLVDEKKKWQLAILSIAFVGVAGWYSYHLAGTDTVVFGGMFVLDGFALFFKMVFYIATVLSIMLSLHYLKVESISLGEYYVLMLFSLCGMMVIASGADLLTIYLGLELMSLPVYVLVGFERENVRSTEASMKYIILGAFSSGILLYGISIVYGLTGTTQLSEIAGAVVDSKVNIPLFSLAVVMLVSGFGFKIAATPFHMWAPDAYEGAPTPITAFMSVGPKAGAFAALLRVFVEGLHTVTYEWQTTIAVVAVASMILGNVVAIAQSNIKRMLAYSSIGHAGYALLGLVAGGNEGIASVMYYLLVYAFMNLGVFAIIVMMRRKDTKKGDEIDDYTGLAKSCRGIALLMLIFLFSLAGIPPTAGFVAKFYIFMALIHKDMILLAVIAVVMSAVAAYYYIRIVMLMYMREPEESIQMANSRGIYYVLIVALIGVVLLGIYPTYFIELARIASNLF